MTKSKRRYTMQIGECKKFIFCFFSTIKLISFALPTFPCIDMLPLRLFAQGCLHQQSSELGLTVPRSVFDRSSNQRLSRKALYQHKLG